MSIKTEGYCLYRYKNEQDEAVYLLTRIVRPEYPLSLWQAESWAFQVYERTRRRLVQQFERSETGMGLGYMGQVGEWVGGSIDSCVLASAKPFSVHRLWYSTDMHYPCLFGFEICDTEEAFWHSMSKCELAGIVAADLNRPARQIVAFFLGDDTYAEGTFPYTHLGKTGSFGAGEMASTPRRGTVLQLGERSEVTEAGLTNMLYFDLGQSRE
ncbi:MAG: hypothetical protein JXR76_09325 [Deltaproteobacteria bacterium]|nr:hypothetical protein [Deltaproteobacteria bacterium]